MITKSNRILSAAVAAVLGVEAPRSLAADSAAAIEEIVVTAQKREQGLQDVGISVTAFTAEQLARLGFTKASDVQFQTPGMVVSYASNSSVPNFVLRGVGLNDFTPLNSSPVAVHLDEVYYAYTPFLNFGLYDIERVEVLKGPQGTLYGRNTTGGAVNYYTVAPGAAREASIKTTFADYEHAAAEGFVNLPLGETAASRVSFSRTVQNDGPWENDTLDENLGELDRWAVRGQLRWDPSERLGFNLNVHGGKDDSDGSQYSFLPANTADGSALCDAYQRGSLSGGEPDCYHLEGQQEPDSDPFTVHNGLANRDRLEGHGAVLRAEFAIGELDLVSVTGYEELERDSTEDADGFAEIMVDELYQSEFSQISEELRVSQQLDALFWTAGLYVSSDEIDTARTEYMNATHGFGGGANHRYVQRSEPWAVFAHGEWAVQETLSLIAGLRYTEEQRSFDGGTYLTPSFEDPPGSGFYTGGYTTVGQGFPLESDPANYLVYRDETITFENLSGKLGVDYRPAADWLVYASVSTGFKSGGWAGDVVFSDAALEHFDEEKVLAWELGFKSTLLDGTLQWNAAAYYYDYTDVILAINETVTNPVTGGTSVIFRNQNAADAVINGLETDLRWSTPLPGLRVDIGVSLIDTEMKDPLPGNEFLDGNELTFAPDASANGTIEYSMPLGDSLLLDSQLSWTWREAHFGETSNSAVSEIDSYTLLNARIGVQPVDARWEVSLWAANLGDERYVTYINDLTGGDAASGLGAVLTTAGYPRTWGVDLSYRWR